MFKVKNNKAFTLLELIVIVAVIAILSIALVPMASKQIDKSKYSKTKADLDSYIKAVNMF